MSTNPTGAESCTTKQAGRFGQRGFTIIELLVVVTIISLLVSIIAPSLTKARLLAKKVACQANLRAIGIAAQVYEADFEGYVPICWANIDPKLPRPWKSWRVNLLPYAPGAAVFGCPAATNTGGMGETFQSEEEIEGHELYHTVNAGSYGVIYQWSLPSFRTENYSDILARGHPMWSCAFSTTPGMAWRDPTNSVYVADSCLTKGPITYPTNSYKNYGSSAIVPPSDERYFDVLARRFADRHCGTNCLFLGGYVLSFSTKDLDEMVAGTANCVWDTE